MLFLKEEKKLKLFLSLKRRFFYKHYRFKKFYRLNFRLTYFFLHNRILLHAGNKFLTILVKKNMLGHYAGEFIFMCKRVFFRVKKKK